MPVAKASLTNLETLETWEFQFNPVDVQRAVGVRFTSHNVPGLDHSVIQYDGTDNRTLTVRLVADGVLSRPYINEAELDAFLNALTVPSNDGGDVYADGPPSCLFNFPNLVTMEGFVTGFSTRFVPSEEKYELGKMGQLEVQVSFIEWRVIRASSQDLRAEQPYEYTGGFDELDAALGR